MTSKQDKDFSTKKAGAGVSKQEKSNDTSNMKKMDVTAAEADVVENKRVQIRKVRDSEAGGMQSVKNEEYFHGFMPKEQTQKILVDVGDFLVRQAVRHECKTTSMEQFIISLRITESMATETNDSAVEDGHSGPGGKTDEQVEADKKRAEKELVHVIIKYSRRARLYYVKDYGFKLVSGLIEYHKRHGLAIDDMDHKLKKAKKRADWQLNHEQIIKTKKLGDGAFGEVFLGSLRTGLISRLEVAIKTVNGTITVDENEKLFQEAMLMKLIVHPNVLQLIGVASNEEPVMIILELAPGGSVVDVVRKKPGPTTYIRIKYCFGAAKGIQYLSSKDIIHRDIAARNVLIGKHNEAKISDFGLSIVGGHKKEKKLKKVPVPYLAPETLASGIYNKGTDVWSFGVFLWEVFHNGREPYEQLENNNAVKKAVLTGTRLELDPNVDCPPVMWEITTQCWLKAPERLSIDKAVDRLQEIVKENTTTAQWMKEMLHLG